MAKKKQKPAAPKSGNVKFEVRPLTSSGHLMHEVFVQDPYQGKVCRFSLGAEPGTSSSESATNLAPGFIYNVRHSKRKDGRCKWTVVQGPFVGTTSAATGRSTMDPPPPPIRMCVGMEGCSFSPCPADKPILNCATNQCEPLVGPSKKKTKKGR
jgi:hypothetical protein